MLERIRAQLTKVRESRSRYRINGPVRSVTPVVLAPLLLVCCTGRWLKVETEHAIVHARPGF